MIADPGGPSSITRTVGRRRYADDASVSHDPDLKSAGEDYSVGIRRYDRVGVSSARSSSGVEIK
jgi:hypothetical protein